MQSGQDCLIYHMLGNSLRRLHVSRTKIGSLLTGWFAERLWAELAFKPFNSPEHPPNPSCSVHSSFQALFGLLQGFLTGEKLKLDESKVQTIMTLITETEGQGKSHVRTRCEKTLPYVKAEWERSYSGLSEMLNFTVCLSLLYFSDSVRKEKLPAIWVKGLLREHKEKRSLGQNLMKVWKYHDPNLDSVLLKDPSSLPPRKVQRICSAESVWYAVRAQWWHYMPKPVCVLWSRYQLGAKMDSHTHGVLRPATGRQQGVGLSRIYLHQSAFLPNKCLTLEAVGVCNYPCTPSNSSSTRFGSLSGFEGDLTYSRISF